MWIIYYIVQWWCDAIVCSMALGNWQDAVMSRHFKELYYTLWHHNTNVFEDLASSTCYHMYTISLPFTKRLVTKSSVKNIDYDVYNFCWVRMKNWYTLLFACNWLYRAKSVDMGFLEYMVNLNPKGKKKSKKAMGWARVRQNVIITK